jgi:hypothetical protein
MRLATRDSSGFWQIFRRDFRARFCVPQHARFACRSFANAGLTCYKR